ncbi:MAG: hypothetical protein Q4Q28_09495 [Bacteroidales bacterium]|nr:hypothetical protein [Bacteroidales bacterium]
MKISAIAHRRNRPTVLRTCPVAFRPCHPVGSRLGATEPQIIPLHTI